MRMLCEAFTTGLCLSFNITRSSGVWCCVKLVFDLKISLAHYPPICFLTESWQTGFFGVNPDVDSIGKEYPIRP